MNDKLAQPRGVKSGKPATRNVLVINGFIVKSFKDIPKGSCDIAIVSVANS